MDWTPDTWGEVLAVLGVGAILLKLFDWRIRLHIDDRLLTVRDQLREDIERHTQPIKPGYRNGGSSLSDVAHRLERLEQHLRIEEA